MISHATGGNQRFSMPCSMISMEMQVPRVCAVCEHEHVIIVHALAR